MQEVKLLWTGGWDSTYRLVELSRMPGLIILPYYVKDPERTSSFLELEAMDKILKALNDNVETKSQINPYRVILLEDICEIPEITSAYKSLSQRIRLGTQYDWLARLAYQVGPFEIGIEKPNGEYSGCISAIEMNGRFTYNDEGNTIIDKDNSDEEIIKLFGNMMFPIKDITEVQMLENINKWKYQEIMKNIWFCYGPINGVPCGTCRPCTQKMECNMKWLLPYEARSRYYRNHLKSVRMSMVNKLGAVYHNIIRK